MRLLFVVFELLTFVLLFLCLLHVRNRGRTRFIELLTLIVYGVVLEELTILFFREYEYGDGFLFMIKDVPLAVGVAWAAIIYCSMETSDLLGIPLSVRPMFDTLLALNIDLSMDAIAIRAGFWKWNNGGEWFGVPYGNFLGWICVVFFFSLTARWLRKKQPMHDVLSAGAMLAGSIVPLIMILEVWDLFVPHVIKGALIAGILLAFLSAVLIKTKGKFQAAKPDYRILTVPFTFHIFFLVLLINRGFYVQVPALLPLSVGMMMLGVAAHFPHSIRSWASK